MFFSRPLWTCRIFTVPSPMVTPGALALKQIEQINLTFLLPLTDVCIPPTLYRCLTSVCFWVQLKMCPILWTKQRLIYSKIWIPKWCKYNCDSWCVYHCGILWWFRMWSIPRSVLCDHWLSNQHCKSLTNHQAVKGTVYKPRHHWIYPSFFFFFTN